MITKVVVCYTIINSFILYYYNMIAINLSKQQAVHADPKAMLYNKLI